MAFAVAVCVTTPLLMFVHQLERDMQGGGQMDFALVDFAKAFDKVPHRRLLIKLSPYGILCCLGLRHSSHTEHE